MRVEQGETTVVSPQPTEYQGRIATALWQRSHEIRGSISALNDMLHEQVKSLEDLNTLLSAAQRRLTTEQQEEIKIFLFSYVEEVVGTIARLVNKKGNNYDA